MIDYRLIRNEPDRVRAALLKRGYEPALADNWLAVDARWRETTTRVETLTAEKNQVSKQIAIDKKEGKDASETIARMRALGDEIQSLEEHLRQLEEERDAELLMIPNLPHESAPEGLTAEQNVEVHRWGNPIAFDFTPKPHWEIAETLDIIDFERGAKISGSGFIVYKGAGATLERAILNYMLDMHTRRHGYTEIFPPFLVRTDSMVGTGQLPKFQEDMYHCAQDELYLIPTAEVPVTNLLREEILDATELPIRYAAYSPCFRRESGAAGRHTRGLQRVHQFNKVELVKFTLPEQSYEEHESLLKDAETVLQSLGITYRVMLLCAGDMGFAAAKCYDVEIWSPGLGEWLEVSSCSNFEDFQARRAQIRFRRGAGAKPEFVHTLNASGVAMPRLMATIIEQYQQADGSLVIPEPIRPYMGGLERISRG